MKFLSIIFLLYSFSVQAQQIPSYSANRLMARASNNDTLYIVNFWATWCVPCVKELPCFDTLQKLYADKPVKILLVSFDFKENVPGKLHEFITKKKLQPEVVWFNETDANTFIPKIYADWAGSLPGTLIIQKSKSFKRFFENEISVRQVCDVVNKQLAH